MNEPVGLRTFYPRGKDCKGCIVDELDELENAIIFDDKRKFLRLIKDSKYESALPVFNADTIFLWDALDCAIAVMKGETEGLYEIKDVLKECTPLHFAAIHSSVGITNYLLEIGHSVDERCDWPDCNLKQGTPIDFLLENLSSDFLSPRWINHHSVYEMLIVLCCERRDDLEVLRMLVRNTQNKDCLRQTFVDYAKKRELVPVALLFLAAPELFLSPSCSIVKLYDSLNSLENRTDIEEAMLLLVDALILAGHKFVAYTRLQYPNKEAAYLDIAFLIREVARIKQGLPSPDDYFLRFFKPVSPEADQLENIPGQKGVEYLPDMDDMDEQQLLPVGFQLKKHDLHQSYINEVLPSLRTEDADRLNKAIGKKLSLMQTLGGCHEPIGLQTFHPRGKDRKDCIVDELENAIIFVGTNPIPMVPRSLSRDFGLRRRPVTYMASGGLALFNRA